MDTIHNNDIEAVVGGRIISSGGTTPATGSQFESYDSQYVYYRVKSNEFLSGIAVKLGVTNWTLIYDANRDQISNPNVIQPGMLLRIPRSAFKNPIYL